MDAVAAVLAAHKAAVRRREQQHENGQNVVNGTTSCAEQEGHQALGPIREGRQQKHQPQEKVTQKASNQTLRATLSHTLSRRSPKGTRSTIIISRIDAKCRLGSVHDRTLNFV